MAQNWCSGLRAPRIGCVKRDTSLWLHYTQSGAIGKRKSDNLALLRWDNCEIYTQSSQSGETPKLANIKTITTSIKIHWPRYCTQSCSHVTKRVYTFIHPHPVHRQGYEKVIDLIVDGAWDPNDPFRIECLSNPAQKLPKLVKCCPKNEPAILGNIELKHFDQKLPLYRWFPKPSQRTCPWWLWDHFMFSQKSQLWLVLCMENSMFPKNSLCWCSS